MAMLQGLRRLLHRKPVEATKADVVAEKRTLTYERVAHIALDVLLMVAKGDPCRVATYELARNFKRDMMDLHAGRRIDEIAVAIEDAWHHHMLHMVGKTGGQHPVIKELHDAPK